MKKLFAILLAAALILSLAACGKSDSEGKGDSGESTTAEPVRTEEKTEPATDAPTETETEPVTEPEPETEAVTEAPETEASDDALIEEALTQLMGEWTVSGVDMERLTFREDGTGTYTGIFDKDCTFTYAVSILHTEDNWVSDGTINLLHVAYDTGESEDITFDVRGDAGEKMVLHNGDYTSGYSGFLNFDEFVRP